MKSITPILAVLVVALILVVQRIQNNSLAAIRKDIADLRLNHDVMWTANKGGTNEITGWAVNISEAMRQIEIYQIKSEEKVSTYITPRLVEFFEAGKRKTNEWKTYYMTHE